MRADSFAENPYSSAPQLKLNERDQLHSHAALKNISTRLQQKLFPNKDNICSVGNNRNRRGSFNRNSQMKLIKGVTKKGKNMDYTNYAYNEAVGRLKLMLADSYATPKNTTYIRNFYDNPADNFSDSVSVIERPVLSDISKYLSPSQKVRMGVCRPKHFTSSKENLIAEATPANTITSSVDYYSTVRPFSQTVQQTLPVAPPANSVQAPVEIFDFIEKQEDYIQQLEKESSYCRNELSHLLDKVKDVINENEMLTETARTELAALSGYDIEQKRIKSPVTTTGSSESDDNTLSKKKSTLATRKKDSPRYANAPKIVYEARISELEAELMQANIDSKRLKQENDELKRKLANVDNFESNNCDAHRKQIEQLQLQKKHLEESVRQLQKSLDEVKSEQLSGLTSKRYVNELMQMERSQAEIEVKHLRDELDRQHERVRELQHEMARRISEERANAERRYNNQFDQLGGDLSNQWEQVAKLQLELERQKRYESDIKRDLASRTAQVEELKMELRSNRSTFLADMAQINAEKQSLEQEITSLRLQLDRGAREHKTEAARLNAEINSLRQRLDRGDADLLHSKREVLRLNDEIANLEKELAFGDLKNEVRPNKRDLGQRISEMQEKHAETVNELEEMIQSQKQLMDKLTGECRTLTKKLEETTVKHNEEKKMLREMNQQLLDRLKQIWATYKKLRSTPEPLLQSNSDNEIDREEHFNTLHSTQNTQQKPLSTTSRPHLAQPMAPPLRSVITPLQNHRHPTTMTQLLTSQQLPINTSQILQSPQHPQPNTSNQTAATITANVPKTMMKISKTSMNVKKNKVNKESNNQQAKQSQIHKTLKNTPRWNPKLSLMQTYPQNQSEQETTLPITAAMKTMISNNTTPALTKESTIQSRIMPHRSMMQTQNSEQELILMETTQEILPTLQQQPTNMILQQQVQTSSPKTLHKMSAQSVPHHQSTLLASFNQQQAPINQQLLQLVVEAQQPLSAEPHQKAVHNRERAVALWGRQLPLEQSAEENPLCHNSPPRPAPKCNEYSDFNADLLNPLLLTYDPVDFNEEFTISSPSLYRSFESSDTYIIEDQVFDSLSEMSISPPRTAIRRDVVDNPNGDHGAKFANAFNIENNKSCTQENL